MPRIACVSVPDLPLAAVLRAEPQLVPQPLAVVQAGAALGGRAHVLAATPAAAGVVPGQTLTEARALCPGLLVRAASAERERAAAQAALEACAAVSPRVEEGAPGLVYLDAEGLDALFGDARAVASALVLATERVGLRAAVGWGASKAVARLAARAAQADFSLEETRQGAGGGAFRIVAEEEQRAFLAAVPLDALALPPELRESLRRFGLWSLGDVARLPPGPLAARLGSDATALCRLARGEDGAPLSPRPAPERLEEGEELEWDACALTPLLFVWKALLGRLFQRLAARGQMARALCLQLRLAGGVTDERAIDLAAPTREAPALLQLLKLELEARPPAAAVCAVRLCAVPTREVLEQMPLFGRQGASPTQLAMAVARLSALVGPGRLGRPCAVDSWAPFAAGLAQFAPPGAPLLPEPRQTGLSLAARALRPPRTVEVRCDARGTPLLVIGEGALGGRVVASAGPWRTEAQWWTEAPVALDSWDLELAGGLLLRVSRELQGDGWLVEAIYD